MKWFERKFELGMPAWMLPNLIERLRDAPLRLETRVAHVSATKLTRRVDGKWSIQEHVGHLFDLESLWSARLDDFESGAKVLSAADVQNRKTHDARHNQNTMQNLLAEFREARSAFVERLSDYDQDFVVKPALHPRLNQPMNIVDLAYFVAEHDDHHLAAITASLQQTGHNLKNLPQSNRK